MKLPATIPSCFIIVALLYCTVEARRCPVFHAAGDAETTGCYIIVLKEATTREEFKEMVDKVVGMAEDAKLYGSVSTVAKAFTVKLSPAALHEVRTLQLIDYIEEETMAKGDQSSSLPWHVDRVDERRYPLDQSYQPIGNGEGVDIYILDSGVNYLHSEFENRAKYPGYDPMDVYEFDLPSRFGQDCHGHGTHVASLAGGKTFGTARKANIYSVRVLNCENFGPWTTVLDGLDYVARVILERDRPAVVSMSLSGGFMQSVNSAVQNLHSRGIPVVVAAGNSQIDSCQRTPAGSPFVITVAGSSDGDGIYTFTNHGPCVDIFAPGQSILGADHMCNTCSKFLSGTSMSAPKVSGVVAIHLQRKPWMSVEEIRSALIEDSTVGALNLGLLPIESQETTPNRLLHIAGFCGGNLTAVNAQLSIWSPNHPLAYPSSIHCVWTIYAPPGRRVELTITDLDTELRYDTVKVCDGSCYDSGVHIAEFSGQLEPGSPLYRSTGSALTVEFSTDDTEASSGFQASYSAVLADPVPTNAPESTVDQSLVCDSENSVIDEEQRLSPIVLQEAFSEASALLQQVIDSSLDGLLEQRLRGLVPDYPALSCKDVLERGISNNSGYFWIENSRGGAVEVFCDLQSRFRGRGPGWIRVANVDMRDPNQACPSGLRLVTEGQRSCGRTFEGPGCSAATFNTLGVSYSKVCGRVIGYQYSSPNAFYQYQFDTTLTIDDFYVDGVSLTYGVTPRIHVWTFAAARDETGTDQFICPCTNTQHTLPDTAVPDFIGENYFCETGSRSTFEFSQFYSEDPLWDGEGCGATSTCCGFNNPPWFCRDLEEVTSADLELRVCGNEDLENEDTPVEIVELYIQHCKKLKELYFAGPNNDVKSSDLVAVASLENMEVLVVNRQISFCDDVLSALGRSALNLRELSCEACYEVSNAGLQCLTSCSGLTSITFSYCHKVTDDGLASIASLGLLEKVVLRACQAITDTGMCVLAEKCTRLSHLDICGCLNISSRALYALQESVLHMRDPGNRKFTLSLGGSGVDGEVATKFARATGATITLHDLSINRLSHDYDPFMEIPSLMEDSEEEDGDPHSSVAPGSYLEAEPSLGHAVGGAGPSVSWAEPPGVDYLMERAEDFLTADDPAMFSDDFSDPDDWVLND